MFILPFFPQSENEIGALHSSKAVTMVMEQVAAFILTLYYEKIDEQTLPTFYHHQFSKNANRAKVLSISARGAAKNEIRHSGSYADVFGAIYW